MELAIELKKKITEYEHDGEILTHFKVENNMEYEQSIDIIKSIKVKCKELEAERKKITEPLDATKKAVMDLFRKPLNALENAEEIIKKTAFAFVQIQETIRLEEQKRLQEEAEAKKIELEEKIAKSQAQGVEYSELEVAKSEIITPVLQSNVAKISGTYIKKTWKSRIVDFKAMPDEYKLPNEKALNGLAQATCGTMVIAGVEFYQEEQLITRGDK